MAGIRTKLVTWRGLKKGMLVNAVRYCNATSWANYIVESANMSTVTLLRWGKEKVEYDAEQAMFEVEIPREEFEKLHREKTKELLLALQNELPDYGIGCHRMENSWINYDPFEMAVRCVERKIKVIGICRTIPSKDKFADIGICAEEEDGTRFWCHACGFHLNLMFEWNRDLL